MKNSILRNLVKVFLKEKNKKLSNFFKNAFKTQKNKQYFTKLN
jgi:hypothetical protein